MEVIDKHLTADSFSTHDPQRFKNTCLAKACKKTTHQNICTSLDRS